MSKTPNILFFLSDQHRGDWLGLYGELPLKTPNIDSLAAEGVCFTQACCTSPLCAPSRASLAAGKYANRTGVPNNLYDFPEDQDTFYKHLRDSGYKVCSVGKNDLHKKTFYNGIEGWTARMGRLGFTDTIDSAGKWNTINSLLGENSGEAKKNREKLHENLTATGELNIDLLTVRDPYMAYLFKWDMAETHIRDYMERIYTDHETYHPTPLPRRFYADDFVGRGSLEMLDKFPLNEPWFLQVNFSGPHDPFDAPEELLQKWSDVEFPLPPDEIIEQSKLSREEHQKVRRNYAAQLEGIDEWIGKIIEGVRDRGELDNTLIVYASDHGEMLGNHGLWQKKVFYEPSLRIPMILAGKGINKKSIQSAALVELLDLAPTFLEAADLDIPDDWDGESLLQLLNKETGRTKRDVQVSELDGNFMVFDGRWKLINRKDEKVLYDLHNDPAENKNLADNYPELVEELTEKFYSERE